MKFVSGSQQLVECVPNISEGIDSAKLERIIERVLPTGVQLLHVDSGIDTNRTVLTFSGTMQRVSEAVRELFRACAQELDMSSQSGAHPRVGAIDVCPFIPLRGVSCDVLNQAVCILAEEMSEAYDLPIYLYEWSAKIKSRRALSSIRQGGSEALRARIQSTEWAPDFGPALLNKKLGATVMGVRELLVAYNINLKDASLEQAQNIAARVRRSSQYLRAIGWDMPTYNCRQVSMNLPKFWEFGMYEAFEVCRVEAAKEGIELAGSELIGLVPLQALIDAGEKFLKNDAVSPEQCIEQAISSMGFGSVRVFEQSKQILERVLGEEEPLSFPIN